MHVARTGLGGDLGICNKNLGRLNTVHLVNQTLDDNMVHASYHCNFVLFSVRPPDPSGASSWGNPFGGAQQGGPGGWMTL